MDYQHEYMITIKQKVIENLQDVFVYSVSIYNFWTWIVTGTYKYFDGWEVYNWLDFIWTMIWQFGSMYLLWRRISYIRAKESVKKEEHKEKTEEEIVVDLEQYRKLGLLDKLFEYVKSVFKF